MGKITLVPGDPEDEQYLVTFNDGRTSYGFNQEHLQVEQDYNYEVLLYLLYVGCRTMCRMHNSLNTELMGAGTHIGLESIIYVFG